MTEMILLSEAQMARISPFFPLSHGMPRVDDRRVINGIIFVIRNGLRWRDEPASYGPHKTIYSRCNELGNRDLGCPVYAHKEVELAFGGLHFGYINVKEPYRIAFELLALRLVALHIRQA